MATHTDASVGSNCATVTAIRWCVHGINTLSARISNAMGLESVDTVVRASSASNRFLRLAAVEAATSASCLANLA
ncbi:MAG: hypothetical protein ACO390_01030 [bacterium]